MWGARKQTKKQRFRKCVFIIVCPNGSLFHPCGGQGKGKNEKTTFYKMWFFRGLPIRVSMSSMWGASEQEKTKKTRFGKCVFSRGLYGSLFQPFGGQASRKKTKKTRFGKFVFFRGLPVLVSISPMWGARDGKKKRKNHVLENMCFSWFFQTGLYFTHVGDKGREKTKKITFYKMFHGLPVRGQGKEKKTKATSSWALPVGHFQLGTSS